MDKAKHNERPTEVYVQVLRKEGASAQALGEILTKINAKFSLVRHTSLTPSLHTQFLDRHSSKYKF